MSTFIQVHYLKVYAHNKTKISLMAFRIFAHCFGNFFEKLTYIFSFQKNYLLFSLVISWFYAFTTWI